MQQAIVDVHVLVCVPCVRRTALLRVIGIETPVYCGLLIFRTARRGRGLHVEQEVFFVLVLELILVLCLPARDKAVALVSARSEGPAQKVRRMRRRDCLLLSYLRDIHFLIACGADLRALLRLSGEELMLTEELNALALACASAEGKSRLLL